MTLIELFVQKGALNEEQRLRVSERLVAELMRADNVPSDLTERGRTSTHVVVTEADALAGGRPHAPSDPPRFAVRATVTAGHLNDGMRAEMVGRITRVLSDFDDSPGRLYHEPNVWVYIVEIPDGNIGAFGQVVRTGDIMQIVLNPGFRPVAPADTGENSAIDPICGMTVTLTSSAITMEREDATFAFCSTACRDIFVRQRSVASA
jgi:YHS domain-containing protein/phenylpyruvate tautomerase PptA (4-oxalocrotonate tautomerase family)